MGPKDRDGRDRGSQEEQRSLVPRAPPRTDGAGGREPFRALLAGDNERDILRRITEDDPLWLRGRSDARMRALAYLIWLPRLELKSAARVAHAALDYGGEPPLAEWLASQVDLAIEDVLVEDREALAEPGDYDFAAKLWRTTADVARRSIVAFNDLPLPTRRAYWALAIDGRSISDCVALGMGTNREIAARVKRALVTLLDQRDPGGPDAPDGGRRVR